MIRNKQELQKNWGNAYGDEVVCSACLVFFACASGAWASGAGEKTATGARKTAGETERAGEAERRGETKRDGEERGKSGKK